MTTVAAASPLLALADPAPARPGAGGDSFAPVLATLLTVALPDLPGGTPLPEPGTPLPPPAEPSVDVDPTLAAMLATTTLQGEPSIVAAVPMAPSPRPAPTAPGALPALATSAADPIPTIDAQQAAAPVSLPAAPLAMPHVAPEMAVLTVPPASATPPIVVAPTAKQTRASADNLRIPLRFLSAGLRQPLPARLGDGSASATPNDEVPDELSADEEPASVTPVEPVPLPARAPAPATNAATLVVPAPVTTLAPPPASAGAPEPASASVGVPARARPPVPAASNPSSTVKPRAQSMPLVDDTVRVDQPAAAIVSPGPASTLTPAATPDRPSARRSAAKEHGSATADKTLTALASRPSDDATPAPVATPAATPVASVPPPALAAATPPPAVSVMPAALKPASSPTAPTITTPLSNGAAPAIAPPRPTATQPGTASLPQTAAVPPAVTVAPTRTVTPPVATTEPVAVPVIDAKPVLSPEPALVRDAPAPPSVRQPVTAPPVAAVQPAPAAILPALQAFGAALHRAAADERRPVARDVAVAEIVATAPAAFAPLADTAPVDTTQHRWPEAMMARIEAVRDAQNDASTRIRLHPDALGAVDVAVRHDGTAVHVSLHAAEPATRQLLAEAQPRLAELAETRGLRLASSDVGGGNGQREADRRQPTAVPARAAPRPAAPDAATDTPTDTRIA